MLELKNNPAGNFFLLAGPCAVSYTHLTLPTIA